MSLIGIGMHSQITDLVPVLNDALLGKTMKNYVTKYKKCELGPSI